MGQADLHIHTIFSKDGTATIEAVLKHAHRAGLDLIAITDHDEIEGALKAETIGFQYHVGVIPGIEVSTAEGHLLTLFVRTCLPAGKSLGETLQRVNDAGGVAIAAHPLAVGAHSLNETSIRRALETEIGQQTLVGIESLNASLFYRGSNARAARLALRLGLAAVGCSDSHVGWNIGHARTFFHGHTPADLRKALLERKTMPIYAQPRRTSFFFADHILRTILRRLGWVRTWGNSARAPVLQRLERVHLEV
ncbi:MAG: PHP domain-containing protein [Chloroflexota bacterium]